MQVREAHRLLTPSSGTAASRLRRGTGRRGARCAAQGSRRERR
ncbi:hypothetical protein ACFPRL_29810 [Pseudoclavibacter helvolus]